jgi:hypothetical protein
MSGFVLLACVWICILLHVCTVLPVPPTWTLDCVLLRIHMLCYHITEAVWIVSNCACVYFVVANLWPVWIVLDCECVYCAASNLNLSGLYSTAHARSVLPPNWTCLDFIVVLMSILCCHQPKPVCISLVRMRILSGHQHGPVWIIEGRMCLLCCHQPEPVWIIVVRMRILCCHQPETVWILW